MVNESASPATAMVRCTWPISIADLRARLALMSQTLHASHIRSAAFADLDPRVAYQLWQLRARIFIVEQDCPYMDMDGRDMESDASHLWVERHGTPVGCLRVLKDPDSARIGRVAVAQEHRGAGLAAELMRAALAQVGEQDCVLDAQSHLTHWYARLGFESDGPEFLEDGIPHTPMRRRATTGQSTSPDTAGSAR